MTRYQAKTVLLCLFLMTCLMSMAQTPLSQRTMQEEWQRLFPALPSPRSVSNHQSPHTGFPAPGKPPAATTARQSIPTLRQPAAYNARSSATVCFDTAGRYFVKEDTMTYYVGSSTPTADGNILVSGQWASRNAPYPSGGYLMKCTDSGTVHWTRLYDSASHIAYSFFYYYQVRELQDGSILLAGITNDQVTGNNDLVFTRTDAAGNILWTRNFKSSYWTNGSGSADAFNIQGLKQDPLSGDLFFTSPHWADGYNLTRMRSTDGTIVWSKTYGTGAVSGERPFGFVFRNNELVSFGIANSYQNYLTIYRVDMANGNLLSNKALLPVQAPNSYELSILQPMTAILLDNGNFALAGSTHRYWGQSAPTDTLIHAAVIELDPNGDFVQAYTFRNTTESNSYNTKITLFPDGSGVFSMCNVISGYKANVYYIQFKNGQILKQRRRYYLGDGMPNESAAIRRNDGSDLIVKLLGDSITNINKIEFLRLQLSDTASGCLGFDDYTTFTKPYQMVPATFVTPTVGPKDLYETVRKTVTVTQTDPYNEPACRQIAHCDTISLVIPSNELCLTDTLLLKARKNPGCGTAPYLDYDPSLVQSFQAVNDSMFLFTFKSYGDFKLYGSIMGCAMLTDSIELKVRLSKGQVQLGKDTVICPGNTIVFNAGKGYKTYLWQDGSTDSTLEAKTPGVYHILVTDSCGNPYRDTVEVAPHPPIPFDLGPDLSICEKDTVTINAPAGFFNYNWHPVYNINTVTIPSIKVSPWVDTMYYVSAEKSAGCFVYDSVRVRVKKTPPVALGNDLSFCEGDSAKLDAGAGFDQYLWSNGQSSQQLTVLQAGDYWVKALLNGCSASDTLRVLPLYKNPTPSLGNDTILCAGTTRVLDAGAYLQYTWNTGFTGRRLTVDAAGTYAVDVVDQRGCKGSATLRISREIAPPANFLPGDTSICNYWKFEVQPLHSYTAYHWSTGASTDRISTNKAGIYWLEVRDNYQCKGRDTIVIAVKDCLYGFFVPNAFSPNGDGMNDVFKPVIFGPLLQYEFIVYNRWGEVIFRSKDPQRGWDGRWKGSVQGGTFVWTCLYQLDDKPVKKEKGVVLITP